MTIPYPGDDAESFGGYERLRLEAREQVRVGVWCEGGSCMTKLVRDGDKVTGR